MARSAVVPGTLAYARVAQADRTLETAMCKYARPRAKAPCKQAYTQPSSSACSTPIAPAALTEALVSAAAHVQVATHLMHVSPHQYVCSSSIHAYSGATSSKAGTPPDLPTRATRT